jgi:hypothetical protein
MCNTDSERETLAWRQLCGSFNQKQRCFFLPHMFPGRPGAGLATRRASSRTITTDELRSFSPALQHPCATLKKVPYNLK